MAPGVGANAWMQDRQQMAGVAVAYWQQRQEQQLSNDANWGYGNEAAADGTPVELPLLQRLLNDGSQWQWQWGEAQAQAGGASWHWPGGGMADMEGPTAPVVEAAQAVQAAQAATAMAAEGDWSGGAGPLWPWGQGASDMDSIQNASLPSMDVQAQAAPAWSWDQGTAGAVESTGSAQVKTSSLQAPSRTFAAPPGLTPADHTEEDPDKGVAERLTSAVALFLAGEEEEESDDGDALQEPEPSGAAGEAPFSTFGATSLDAPPFVPGGMNMSPPDASQADAQASSGGSTTVERTELRLDDILPKESTITMPSQEGLNDFFAVLRRRALPQELEEDGRKLTVFNAQIAKAILDFYKKRIPPTVKLLQNKLRESGQFPEEWVQSLLLVCARDVPTIYQIRPSMNGDQPVILLKNPPRGFQGFEEQELVQEDTEYAQRAGQFENQPEKQVYHYELMKVFQELLQDETFVLPRQTTKAAWQLQQKIPQFFHTAMPDLENVVKEALRRRLLRASTDGLRPMNFASYGPRREPAPIGPLQPGACSGSSAGAVGAAAASKRSAVQRDRWSWKNQAGSDTSADAQETADFAQVDIQGRQDVSGLLTELMLLFPTGMRFSLLKEHLKRSNDGNFSENTFYCANIASELEGAQDKVHGGTPPASLGKGTRWGNYQKANRS